MPGWLPLESNPEVLTQYLHKGGVSDKWAIVDVLGLEPEMLDWIPNPVKSIILLFPISEADESLQTEHERSSNDLVDEKHQNLFYMRQLTSNACGTVALIHAVANNKDITLSNGWIKNFLEKVKDLSPQERGLALETDKSIAESHRDFAQEGQTTADPNEKVEHHFISFINKDGTLYEMDGRKGFPIEHGDTTDETFVLDAAKVCKQFMARDPKELRFTVMALAAAQT